MRVDDPRRGAVHDVILFIAVTLLVTGAGTVAMSVTGHGAATEFSRPGHIAAATSPASHEPAAVLVSSQHTRPDAMPSARLASENQDVELDDRFTANRLYLLEMSARLRRTTLGADASTRDAVSAEILYRSLGLAGSPQSLDFSPAATPSP